MAIIHGSAGEGQRTRLALALAGEGRVHTLPVLIDGVLHMQICSTEPLLFPDYDGALPSGATEVGRRARGYHGELMTSRVLNQLDDEWQVIYDLSLALPGGLYDCDALIVGPKGNWIVDSKFQSGHREPNIEFLTKVTRVLGVPVSGAFYAHWGECRPVGYSWSCPAGFDRPIVQTDGDCLHEAIGRLASPAQANSDLTEILRPSGLVPRKVGSTVPTSIVACSH